MTVKTSREFLMSLKKNDLIRVNGTLRVIRCCRWCEKVKGKPTGTFIFSILRCSWTRRPSTVILSHELRQRTVELVARNYVSKHPVSKLLDDDIANDTRNLNCCDVIGVIS